MSRPNAIDVSVYQKAKRGNYHCGDGYFYYQEDQFFVCVLVDGLGSGEFASESSQAVINVIKLNPLMTITEIVKLSNQALLGKRGVVLGVLKLDLTRRSYTYASIGNIGLMMITADGIKKRNIPMLGYLSVYPRQAKKIAGEIEVDMLFILFSDGVLEKDLTHDLFKYNNVHDITDAFSDEMDPDREDDTTLIAIKYKAL